jgi:hypothetical protein
MPVLSTDLLLYCSANMPEDDTSTSGGGIDATGASSAPGVRPSFSQMSADDTIQAVCDTADTRDITVFARKPDGSIASETKTLTGNTPITLSTLGTVERILKVTLSTTDPNSTVTVRRTTGPVTISTVPPNEKGFRLMFYDAASEASPTIRYEKIFWINKNSTTALNAAKVQISQDASPTGKLRQGITTSKGDTSSVANRKATPGGVTFVGIGVDQNVPTTVLGASEKIGVWTELSLLANDDPIRSFYQSRLSGTTV